MLKVESPVGAPIITTLAALNFSYVIQCRWAPDEGLPAALRSRQRCCQTQGLGFRV